MAQPVVFKNGVTLSLDSLRIILPAVVADASLYLTTALHGLTFDRDYLTLAALVAALCVLMIRLSPADPGQIHAAWAARAINVVSIFARWGMLIAALLAIGYVSKVSATYSRRVVLTWAIVTPVLLVLASLLLNQLTSRVLAYPANARRIVFAGVNDVSKLLADRLQQNPNLGMLVEGYFDDRSVDRLGANGGQPLLGRLPDLVPYLKEHLVDIIVIALPIRHIQRVVDLVDDLRDTTASIYYAPDIFVFDLIQARTLEIAGMPVIAMCETPFSGYRGLSKRVLDIACCVALLPVLIPVMLGIAALVWASSPGPVIFRQRRYGLDGRQIIVYKFRTMTVIEDGSQVTQVTRDDARVTPIGRVLRRYSLDELPQLINVLQGRMSLVGPRPHAVAHNEQYRKLVKGYMLRHKVFPGITGLAQINGCRGETAKIEQMEARVEYDLQYLRHWSLFLDVEILVTTAFQLLRGRQRAY